MKKQAGQINAEKGRLLYHALTNEIVADITNGISKSDIFTKMMNGMYPSQPKPYAKTACYDWWHHALDRIAVDSEDSIEDKRKVLWNRYENLYRESMETGNSMIARQVLSDMGKMFGLSVEQQKELKLKQEGDGTVSVSFNFGNEG